MTVDEAVSRATAIHAEITKRAPGLSAEEVASLVVSATLFQTLDWIEDRLERIVRFMPSDNT